MEGKRIGRLSMLCAVALTVLGAPSASAADPAPCRVRNVTQDTAGRSLIRMVEKAVDGDRLRVRGTCRGPIVIDVDIVLQGMGARPTVTGLDEFSNAPTPLVRVRRHTRVLLRDLTVERNFAEDAAAIVIRPTARVRMERTVVQDNENFGASGGGIANGGSLTLVESIVRRNEVGPSDLNCSGVGGGIYQSGVRLTIKRSRVVDNSAECDGGGVFFRFGSMAVIDSVVSRNSALGIGFRPGQGGGIFVLGGLSDEVTLSGSTVTANSATGQGGGIFVHSISDAKITIVSTTVTDNTPDDCFGTDAC